MKISDKIKRRIRAWLETDQPTTREKRVLGRISRAEELLEKHRQGIEGTKRKMKDVRRELIDEIRMTRQTLGGRITTNERALRINARLLVGTTKMGRGGSRGDLLTRHEASVYSQNGEDGILLYLFDVIGTTNRRFVEIGAGGLENNTNNLFFNFGWCGFWLDMDEAAMARLESYVLGQYPEFKNNYRIEVGKVLPDSIDALVKEYCGEEDPDLLIIDIDSFDAQVLRAIDSVRPRVIGCEYNAAYGLRNVHVPFKEDFSRHDLHRFYYGASLPALSKIASAKGYALVGCDSFGVNCFFVRRDCLAAPLKERTPEEAFRPSARYLTRRTQDEQWAEVAGFPFEAA